MMKRPGLTDTHLRVLTYLVDDQGHPLWEMDEKLKIDESDLSKAINELIEADYAYYVERERSSRKNTRSPNRHEFPIYINKTQVVLEDIRHQAISRIEYHKNKTTQYKANLPFTINDEKKARRRRQRHYKLAYVYKRYLLKWLDTVIPECEKLKDGERLEPKPFTYNEPESLEHKSIDLEMLGESSNIKTRSSPKRMNLP